MPFPPLTVRPTARPSFPPPSFSLSSSNRATHRPSASSSDRATHRPLPSNFGLSLSTQPPLQSPFRLSNSTRVPSPLLHLPTIPRILHYTFTPLLPFLCMLPLRIPADGSSAFLTMPPKQKYQLQSHSVLLSLFFLLFLLLEGGLATRFDFQTLTLGSLKLLGNAHLKNDSILLSRDLPVPNSSSGRTLYADPVRLRHPSTRLPLPFSTFFSFSITNLNPSSIGGGLAFLLTSDDRALSDPGGFLGLLDASTDVDAS